MKKKNYITFLLKINIILVGFIISHGCGSGDNNPSHKLSDTAKKTDCITVMCINDKNEYDKLNEFFQSNNLKQMSGIEYLNLLKGIKCSEITIDYQCYQKGAWIQKTELKKIFEKTQSQEP